MSTKEYIEKLKEPTVQEIILNDIPDLLSQLLLQWMQI